MLGRRDAESRLGVRDHVRDLPLPVQHVDGHEDHAGADTREEQADELDPVREMYAQAVAALEPARRERPGHAVRARVELAERERARAVGRVILERDGVPLASEGEREKIAELHWWGS